METPHQIGRYTVDGPLGSGAMGHVYLGRDPELDRAVAIKVLRSHLITEAHPDDQARTKFLERFKNEARAAARLQHPHIVQVFDVGEDETLGPFLVMEYVPGTTLKHWIRERGALSPEHVVQLARQTAQAIDTAHGAGIVHRDIKPDNLLMLETGDIKLGDFGVARVPNASLTQEGQFLGTPCYAAPETLTEGLYSAASDLFSMAAVLYEAVCGQRAFPGTDAIQVAQNVIHDSPSLPSKVAGRHGTGSARAVPHQVDHVVMKGLEKRPAYRYQSAHHLADSLHHAYRQAGLLKGTRLDSTAPTESQLASSGARKHKTRTTLWNTRWNTLWSTVALVALFGTAGAWLVWQLQTGGPIEPLGDQPAFPENPNPQDAGADTAANAHPTQSSEVSPPPLENSSDASVVASDAGAPQDASIAVDATPVEDATPLSPHEKEEAAKDALEETRAWISTEDWPDALESLRRAQQLDPGNPDIPNLLQQIQPHL